MSLALSICLLVLAILGHGYLWTDIVNRLHACAAARKLVDMLTLACFVAFLVVPVIVLWRWSEVPLFASTQAEPSFGAVAWYVTFCTVWGTYALLRNWCYQYLTDNPRVLLAREREVIDTSEVDKSDLFQTGFAQFLSRVPANQILQLTVERKKLAIPHLSDAHQGLTIAHLSDLHMTGRLAQRWYEFVADQVNSLGADAIVITGDIVEKDLCWPWLAKSLGKLRADCGVYFVLGNHDFYIDVSETKKLLEGSGLICVSNRVLQLQWNDAPVQLAGNEQPWGAEPANLTKLPKQTEDGAPLRLILLHTPDQVRWACENEAHLALAGHTHGGQLRFPILGPIVSPSFQGTRYTSGVFRRGSTVMHVTRGITGKTPLRWNCPPEIALLELARI